MNAVTRHPARTILVAEPAGMYFRPWLSQIACAKKAGTSFGWEPAMVWKQSWCRKMDMQ